MVIKVKKLLSRISQIAFRNRVNEFLYLSILSAVIIMLMKAVNLYSTGILIYLSVFSAILSVTTVRVSNSLVYSIPTLSLGMNLCDSSSYHNYDYREQKGEISELFKKECIEGVLELSRRPYGKIAFITTHKWVYENILMDERITSVYRLRVKKSGNLKIYKEVFSLVSDEIFEKHKNYLKASINVKREKYSIIMIRKGTDTNEN